MPTCMHVVRGSSSTMGIPSGELFDATTHHILPYGRLSSERPYNRPTAVCLVVRSDTFELV